MTNKERDPLGKEKFMQGNRQKWAVVFLLFGTGVFFATILNPGFDPTPFMQFLLAIGSLFILGSSADSWVKAYKVGSLRETQVKEETKRQTIATKDESEPDTVVIQQFEGKYFDDPSYAPLSYSKQQETVENFR